MKPLKTKATVPVTIEGIEFVRGHKVILDHDSLRSQKVTAKETRGGRRNLPYAFTEHGALMAANVQRSARAIQMSVLIVQTFVRLQRMAISMDALARKVQELERLTSENQDQIKKIVAALPRAHDAARTPASRNRIPFKT